MAVLPYPMGRYVIANMLTEDDWSLACATRFADQLSVPPPPQEWVDDVVSQSVARPPPSLRLHDVTHTRSVKWLRDHGLYAWFHKKEAMEGVRRVLADGRSREALEDQLLIRGMPTAQVCLVLQKKLNLLIPQEVIDLFAHYCWAVREMSVSDVMYWIAQDERRANRRDVRNELSARPLQAEQLLQGVGEAIAPDAALKLVNTINTALLLELSARPLTPENIQSITAVSRAITRASAILKDDNSGEQVIAQHLNAFRVRNDRKPPASLAELQGKEGPTFNIPEIPQPTDSRKKKERV